MSDDSEQKKSEGFLTQDQRERLVAALMRLAECRNPAVAVRAVGKLLEMERRNLQAERSASGK